MMRTLRFALLFALLAPAVAPAQQPIVQTQLGTAPAVEVERLAPQLVPFVGGEVNFQNLVNGLAFGLPVTLTTPLSPGVTQMVSFTPAGTMSPAQIAQTLETARQVAIGNGIAAPSAQQLGAILAGGALPTALGASPVTGLVAGTTPSTSLAAPAAALQASRPFSVSDSPLPRGVSDTPTLPIASAPAGTATPGTATTGSTSTATPAPARIMPGAAGATAPAGGPRFGVAH